MGLSTYIPPHSPSRSTLSPKRGSTAGATIASPKRQPPPPPPKASVWELLAKAIMPLPPASSGRRRNHKKTDSYDLDNLDTATVGFLAGLIPQYSRKVWISLAVTLLVTIFLTVALRVHSPASECPRKELPRASLPSDFPRYHGPAVEYEDRFTLVLNSYKRPKLLQRAISHYAQCKDIDTIRVVWCEGGLPPSRSENSAFYSELKEVRYDIMHNSSLNMRFWPLEGLRTEALLSIDDDIVSPCRELSAAFQVWKKNKRNLVGFYPRLHLQQPDCKWKYLMGFGTLMWHGAYSIVLTKASFMHRDYLEHYTNHMHWGIRAHIDKERNCEDIAMQLLVSNVTREPPVFVHSLETQDLGKGLTKVKGISSATAHKTARTTCLNVFAEYYVGALPLFTRSITEHKHSWWLRLSPYTEALYGLFHGRI